MFRPFSTDSDDAIIDYALRQELNRYPVAYVELNQWHEDDPDTARIVWGGRKNTTVERYKNPIPKVVK